MALPPSIPTSFVPKQPVATSVRKRTSSFNPFLGLSYVIVIVALLGCLAVFGYQYYLKGVAKQKADQVTAAQGNIDQATVTDFIRLRDRFSEAGVLLNQHVVLSQFFNALEGITLQGVRFNSLRVSVNEDRTAVIDLSGTARSFNTLAAQSSAFASNKLFKSAIFAGIASNPKDGSVNFTLSATLDPSLVKQGALSNTATPVVAPVAPVTTATTSKSGGATTTKP